MDRRVKSREPTRKNTNGSISSTPTVITKLGLSRFSLNVEMIQKTKHKKLSPFNGYLQTVSPNISKWLSDDSTEKVNHLNNQYQYELN